MTFEKAYNNQINMQVNVFGDGTPLEDYDDERRAQFIKDNALALLDEVHEALGEVGWKPWASSRHLNREAFKGELVDALHFFMNLMGAAGITPDELLEGYFTKAEKNLRRQEAGYDGVSTKCPGCKRALDDDAVDCYPHRQRLGGGELKDGVMCVARGRFVPLPKVTPRVSMT